MTINSPVAPVASAKRPFPLLAACITVIVTMILVSTMLNGAGNSAIKDTSSDLKQARLALIEYQHVNNVLPGVNKNHASLNHDDVLGFPIINVHIVGQPGSGTQSIKYLGIPSGTAFCLVAVPNWTAAKQLQYITSASSKVYSSKPSGC